MATFRVKIVFILIYGLFFEYLPGKLLYNLHLPAISVFAGAYLFVPKNKVFPASRECNKLPIVAQ